MRNSTTKNDLMSRKVTQNNVFLYFKGTTEPNETNLLFIISEEQPKFNWLCHQKIKKLKMSVCFFFRDPFVHVSTTARLEALSFQQELRFA